MARVGILCDREFLLPFDQRVYKEALTLRGAGHEVDIISPHTHSETRELEGLTLRLVARSGPPASTALRMVRKALRGDYDIFHCHELDPLLYSLLLRPLAGKPVVWDCHEYYVPMVHGLHGPLRAALVELALSVAIPRPQARITVDRRLGARLVGWGPTLVLPNYPRAADFPPVSPSAGSRAGSRDGEPLRLIYVGGLTEARGCKVMLEAFRRLREGREAKVILIVAGGFYDAELESWARDYDERHGLNVDWRGWVDHRELAPLLREAEVGLSLLQPLPRYQRAVPTKLYEYLLSGLPVLASRALPVRRLLGPTGLGLTVDATDPAKVARGMERLLDDPGREAMGQRAERLARRLWTWEANEGRLMELYDRLLGGG